MSTVAIVKPFPALSQPKKGDRLRKTDPPQRSAKTNKMADSMNELHQTSHSSADNKDDLQQIKGIGPSIARALKKAGISRYADLASFTPESLTEHLKAEIPSISPQRIERDNWLGQAQALTQGEEGQETVPPEAADAVIPSADIDTAHGSQTPGKESSQVEAGQTPSPSVEDRNTEKPPRDSWRELADYFVSFGYTIGLEGEERLQTKAHHSQKDTLEQWDGVATEQLLKWMLNQADLPVPPEIKVQAEEDKLVESSPPEPTDDEAAFLELSDLWVTEVTMSEAVGVRRSGTLLRAEGRLNVSGPTAARLTDEQMPFSVELFLNDIQTNLSTLVATHTGNLSPGRLVYEFEQNFPAPPTVGRYQLYVVARLLPPGEAATYVQGPLIRVEP